LSIDFTKYSATGNDFIVIDNRTCGLDAHHRAFFQEICRRRTGVGADGVLLIEASNALDFRLRYINADGSEAECGNGARAGAHFALQQNIASEPMDFEFGIHIYTASVDGNTVGVTMPEPCELDAAPGVVREPFLREGGFINTGVPHLVLFCDNLEEIDVETLGRHYRQHSFFQPAGTNVDFVQAESPSVIHMRTYERGVESETLSCGTGCVAAAVISNFVLKSVFPLTVKTRGGTLTVARSPHESRYLLQGEVKPVYQGRLW